MVLCLIISAIPVFGGELNQYCEASSLNCKTCTRCVPFEMRQVIQQNRVSTDVIVVFNFLGRSDQPIIFSEAADSLSLMPALLQPRRRRYLLLPSPKI